MNDTTAPQVHPAQTLIAPDGTAADIDTEIVPLVHALWALGLKRTVVCRRGEVVVAAFGWIPRGQAVCACRVRG